MVQSPEDESIDDVECERAGVDGLLLPLSLDDEWVTILGVLKLLLDGNASSSHISSYTDSICAKKSWMNVSERNAPAQTVAEHLKPELVKIEATMLALLLAGLFEKNCPSS